MKVFGVVISGAIVGCLMGGGLAVVQVRSDLDALTTSPGSTVLVPAQSDEKLPVAKVENPHYEFGKMQRGTSKSHEFVFRNEGEAPLVLRAGKASCKCTSFEVPEKAIPPGGEAMVRVKWSTKSDNGPFGQVAPVYTNDPLHSTIELRINGTIVSARGIEPPDLLFDKIPVGESKTVEVYVMAMLQDELTLKNPQLSDASLSDRFDVAIEPVEAKDLPNKEALKGMRVRVTAKPGLPVGRFQGWLSLETNLMDAENLEIPILGQVVGDINVRGTMWNEERGAVMLGSVKGSEGGRAKVNVYVRGAEAQTTQLALKSVEPPELKVHVQEAKRIKDTLVQVPIEIEVPAGTHPMVHLDTSQGEPGRIVFTTTHPKIKELSINVLFSVER